MYKIIGADDKAYGPLDIDVIRKWMSEGRVNAQTRVLAPGATEWKTVAEIPELSAALDTILSTAAPGASILPTLPPLPSAQGEKKGLAIASLVLGVLSPFCLGFLTGIPAVICGHIALSRAKRSPGEYGGTGLAIAGLVTGYLGIAITVLVMPAMLLPALARAKQRAQQINCVNNMKQVGIAFRTWSLDHQDFPFNVSANAGGTKELRSPGSDGFDRNAVVHFQMVASLAASPTVFICPADRTRTAALSIQNLTASNISYQLRTDVTGSNPQVVLARCPFHGSELFCDGHVEMKRLSSYKPEGRAPASL